MSTAKLAWIGEFLEQARWYRRNAAIRHGHPEMPPTTRPTMDDQASLPVATPTGAPAWAKALAAAALVAGAGAVGWSLRSVGDGGSVVGPPEPTDVTSSEDAKREGSLYQYLEDSGYHRP